MYWGDQGDRASTTIARWIGLGVGIRVLQDSCIAKKKNHDHPNIGTLRILLGASGCFSLPIYPYLGR